MSLRWAAAAGVRSFKLPPPLRIQRVGIAQNGMDNVLVARFERGMHGIPMGQLGVPRHLGQAMLLVVEQAAGEAGGSSLSSLRAITMLPLPLVTNSARAVFGADLTRLRVRVRPPIFGGEDSDKWRVFR